MEAAILDQDPNLDPPRAEEAHSASPTGRLCRRWLIFDR